MADKTDLRLKCEEQVERWMTPLTYIYGTNRKLEGCKNFLTDTLEDFAKDLLGEAS